MTSLATIQPGDQVLYHHHWADTDTLETVDRTSKTQIIIGNRHFRRLDGLMVGVGTGARWRASDWISEAGEEGKEE